MSFTTFPRTPHLAFSTITDADDIILSNDDTNTLLRQNVRIQEKLDGSCIGFSVNHNGDIRAQNRGEFVSYDHPLFKNLKRYVDIHETEIFDICEGDRKTLFGEWMFYQHTVPYDHLPSYFLAHDLYDQTEKTFMSADALEALLRPTNIKMNPVIFRGSLLSPDRVAALISYSQFSSELMEGLYIRQDQGAINVERAKYVRPEFTRGIGEHYRERPLVPNYSLDSIESQWAPPKK